MPRSKMFANSRAALSFEMRTSFRCRSHKLLLSEWCTTMPIKARTTNAGAMSTIAPSPPDVRAQRVINALHKFFPKHLRQLVFLESGMQQQPLKFRVAFVLLERVQGDAFKDGAVVLARNRISDDRHGIHLVVQASFVIQDGAVQLVFCGKVAENHGFRNAGGQCDFLGSGAAKPALRKQAHRHPQNLQAPVFTRHAGTIRSSVPRELGRVSFQRSDLEVSTYLPSSPKRSQVGGTHASGVLACRPDVYRLVPRQQIKNVQGKRELILHFLRRAAIVGTEDKELIVAGVDTGSLVGLEE